MSVKKVRHASEVHQEGLDCDINITVDSNEVDRLIKWKFSSFRNKASMKGFRPGKIPDHIIVQKFGQGLYEELTNEIVRVAGSEALQESGLEAIGQPKLELDQDLVEQGKDFIFSLKFETYPEIPDFNASDLTVSTVECVINDSDIDMVIENIKKKAYKLTEVDNEAAPGDSLLVTYTHKLSNDAGASCEHKAEIILEPELPEEIASVLLGCKSGDEKLIDGVHCSIWDPYLKDKHGHHEHVGEVESIKISVVSVSQREAAEIDGTQWVQFGYQSETLDDLREEIKKDLEFDAKIICQDVNYNVLRPMITNAVDFELPKQPVSEELKRLMVIAKADIDLEQLAQENVKLSLILRDTLKKAKLTVDNERVYEYVMSKSPMKGFFRQFYAKYVLAEEETVNYWSMQVLERQLLDYILNDAVKVVENISLLELKSRAVSE